MEFLQPRRINREDMKDYCNDVSKVCIDFWENNIKKGVPPKNRVEFVLC